MTRTVTALYRYPVKSCRGIGIERGEIGPRGFDGDRGFVIVNENRVFLTQRDIPRLALIVPKLAETTLSLSALGTEPITLPIRRAGPIEPVTVWRDTCEAVDQGDDVANWLSGYLDRDVRLMRMADGSVRRVDPAYARQPDDQVSFADAYPFLLISQASLDDLNSRMGAPLPMNRFRPNIVVAGCEPYAEDSWRTIRIGSVLFDVVKPCARCVTTQIDQATAKQGADPLRTLARYRLVNGGMLFGQNLIHHGPGMISAGDEVQIVAHWF